MAKRRLISVCIKEKAPVLPGKEGIVITNAEISKQQLLRYKKLAVEHPKVDWSKYPDNIRHIVFYSDLRDPQDNVYFATIYLNGACHACTEEEFEELYASKARQYVLAAHKMD